MDVKSWTVCIIEPNRFEGQIILDLLRHAGVEKIKLFADADAALDMLEIYNANVIVIAHEPGSQDGAAWTRAFRRNQAVADRKAAVFVTSGAFSRAMAEQCRHAGANALIGKPLSGKVLTATIAKVLTKPRPFIDAEKYVGPCRRAGIVTAGAPKQRRKVDAEAQAKPCETLTAAVKALADAGAEFLADSRKLDACESRLRQVQAYAVNAGDGPLMRACAAFALQLTAKNARMDSARPAIQVCLNGILRLASTPISDADNRDAVAEAVRAAVSKSALQRAA